MSKRIDIPLGSIFGRLTVLEYVGIRDGGWKCLCNCGKVKYSIGSYLISGRVKSCGCLHNEGNHKTHGFTIGRKHKKMSEYSTWTTMKGRCFTITNQKYYDYGARGITVCDRWLGETGFENFYADMGPKPSNLHSIDRIDNDGHYEPSNCRWGTDEQQSRNKRNNIWLEYQEERMILEDWARRINVDRETIRKHITKGKSFPEIIEFFKKKGRCFFNSNTN